MRPSPAVRIDFPTCDAVPRIIKAFLRVGFISTVRVYEHEPARYSHLIQSPFFTRYRSAGTLELRPLTSKRQPRSLAKSFLTPSISSTKCSMPYRGDVVTGNRFNKTSSTVLLSGTVTTASNDRLPAGPKSIVTVTSIICFSNFPGVEVLTITPERGRIYLPKVARTPSKKFTGRARNPSTSSYFLLNRFSILPNSVRFFTPGTFQGSE